MQGFNMGRYVPPDQEGLTTGNKLAGKHPLGSRARHLHTSGALVVRFEMPFPIWCCTCQPADSVLIGQGVRFNAEKKKVGNYYSTPIYSFRMKHGPCGGWIEIRTDPKNTEYVVTEGARRQARSEFGKGEYEEDGVGEIRVKLPGEESGVEDPFAKFEGKAVDKGKYMTAQTRMEELLKRQTRDWEDPYERSRKLRRVFRAERKGREVAQEKADAIKDKMSLGIELVEEMEADRVRAAMVDFGSSASGSVDDLSSRVRTRPLFESQLSSSKSEAPSVMSDRRKGEKKVSARRAAVEMVAERKAILQRELRGNTKAAMDPFLNEVDEAWQPGIKKRRKGENENKNALKDCDDDTVGTVGPSDTLDDIRNGNCRIDGVRLLGTGQNEPLQNTLALVDYDSDTDD
ncbi:Protein saf4 [Emydomyces testavorans]|uniref:Protein saf4 n=1 Tax=Emydomyces testavorans TaxID=2070801 RepID=A0AAF0DIA5_9EURO|nr:Protein saf4 [Emydomyces testavorans]